MPNHQKKFIIFHSMNSPVVSFVNFKFLGLAVFLLILAACSPNNKQNPASGSIKDTLVYPHITILTDLPDSNRPKSVFLEKTIKPITINVPSGKVSSNDIRNSIKGYGIRPPLIWSFMDSVTKRPIAPDAQGRGFFTTYTTDNGLALDQVFYGYKDSKGNLWFGTNGGGVSKYDGKNFTNYTTAHGLANNVVLCITEDKKGNLWFGTIGGGVSKYDGRSFTNYSTSQGLANNEVSGILEDKEGDIWFGTTGGGVSKYDGSAFIGYTTAQGLANDTITCLLQDKKGAIWFGTNGGGLSEYKEGKFTNYTTAQGLSNNSIWSISEDSSGNIWIGTHGAGICKYDGKVFTAYTMAQGLANNVVRSISDDKSGNLWIGTDGGGISKFDGTTFTNYSTVQGLANNAVRNIVEDEKGNIWISTFGGGVSKFAGKSFTNYTKEQGLANNVVFSINEDHNGDLWFGTSGGGVSKYNGQSITNYTSFQGLANNEVFSLIEDRMHNMWFGTARGGVSKFDGKSFTNYTNRQGLPNNMVFSVHEDKTGNIWLGTAGGGLSKFDGKSFTNYTTAQGLAGNVVFCITEDKSGVLWLGTSGGGVSKFDGQRFTNYTTAQGLAGNMVYSITEDKAGHLWLGTQEGLSLMHNEKAIADQSHPPLSFENYSTKDGLPDNFITQVVVADDQKIYVGTNLGICELVLAAQGNNTEKKWVAGKIFNSLTGYPVKDVNAGQGAMYKDSRGIIWIGTGSDKTGLVRFNPKAINNTALTPPIVVIQTVRINKEKVIWNDLIPENITSPGLTEEVSSFGRPLSEKERDSIRFNFRKLTFDSITKWYAIPEKLVLPHQYNDIGFDFNCIETGKNFLVKYQYMLEGYDKDWSPPDYKSSASFGNIYEGSYTFLLRALSPEGSWSNPVSYSFKVLPPWWRTWWMYLLYAIIAVTVIFVLFRLNHRRIIQQKKILEFKVTVATRQIREEKEKVEAQKLETEKTLTELKTTQTQLIQSEKMASLGELTAGIAHEIQNPLNFVNNFSEVSVELMKEMMDEVDIGNTAEVKSIAGDLVQNLEKINRHGKRADAIVKGMLQHSRSSSGVKEPTDINAICGEYLRLSYFGLKAKDKSFNAAMKTDFDPTIGKISIIPQDIGRVILNLLTNAFYAAALPSKELHGDNIPKHEPTVWVSTKKEGDKVIIAVRDNGPGIPQKIMDKIFQPFFTTKPAGQGTGLGLSLSYDIITKGHSGELKVETKLNDDHPTGEEGTTFIIILPV